MSAAHWECKARLGGCSGSVRDVGVFLEYEGRSMMGAKDALTFLV